MRPRDAVRWGVFCRTEPVVVAEEEVEARCRAGMELTGAMTRCSAARTTTRMVEGLGSRSSTMSASLLEEGSGARRWGVVAGAPDA